jgi:copper(I)-binding protein
VQYRTRPSVEPKEVGLLVLQFAFCSSRPISYTLHETEITSSRQTISCKGAFDMRNRPARIFIGLLCITSLLAAACVPAGGVVIKDAFARATPAGAETGGAFATIVNNGQAADRLVSASSPAAKTAELHETVDENGVMKMVHHPEGWEIPAGGTLELKPGSKHIMLIGLTAPLEAGKKIQITLNFEKAGAQTINVPVNAVAGM